MATIGTRIYTALKGSFVGEDEYGNRYYEARSEKTADGHKKRWVVYKGLAEPTKVTAHWHGWLHYSTDTVPTKSTSPHYKWEKASQPNLTGTTLAYVPPGHVSRGGQRAPTTADYEAWKP